MEKCNLDTELMHYGIKGMKWGVRRFQEKSGRLTTAGKKRYNQDNKSDSEDENTSSSKLHLTEKQKKAVKIGAAVAVGALAVCGTAYLYKSGKLDNLIALGKSKVKTSGSAPLDSKAVNLGKKKVESILDPATGFKKLTKPESISDTISRVNPLRGTKEGANNCTLCGIASFLRQKEYDVIAGSTGGKQQLLGGIVEECFKGANVIDGSATKFGRSPSDAAEMLVKRFGDNASGVVSIQWKDKTIGGHTFNWFIKDGIVTFFDGQSGREDSIVRKYWKSIDPNDSLTLARLDNAEINFEALRSYILNR